ncbi:MAG: hypothetical protein V3T83_03420, partial [Acidobacteriota bacterium]
GFAGMIWKAHPEAVLRNLPKSVKMLTPGIKCLTAARTGEAFLSCEKGSKPNKWLKRDSLEKELIFGTAFA